MHSWLLPIKWEVVFVAEVLLKFCFSADEFPLFYNMYNLSLTHDMMKPCSGFLLFGSY